MKHWGIAISALYAVVVAALALPLWVYLFAGDSTGEGLRDLFDPGQLGDSWMVWVFVGPFIVSQAALLFISIDRSRRRLKPRRRLTTAITATSFTVAVMCLAILSSVIVMFTADEMLDWRWYWLTVPAGLWISWAIVFFLYRERVADRLTQTVGWLLNGSVLQLLVAVPAHIVTRQRDDCCAPMVSGFGIASGVALMLVAFGPSIVFLYQDRLGRHERRSVLPLLAKWPVRTLFATLIIGGAILWFALQSEEPPALDSPPVVAPAAGNL